MEDRFNDDAWKKHYDLVEQNTREWKPRQDLLVEALGCDRSIRLSIIETNYDEDLLSLKRKVYHSTQRNVRTMRELAQALWEAADFVESVNPEWAKGSKHFREIEVD